MMINDSALKGETAMPPDYPVSDAAMQLFRASEEHHKAMIAKVYGQLDRGLITTAEFFAKINDIQLGG
jgi:hypothetical protein